MIFVSKLVLWLFLKMVFFVFVFVFVFKAWSHCIAHPVWELTCLSLFGAGLADMHHHMRKSLNCETWERGDKL